MAKARMRDTTRSSVAPLPWHDAPARWGNPLHSLCSYMAMFPPSMPHVFIRWLTQEGDVVLDPFSGRGTTALEACLLGREGHGSDLNPLAVILTSSKVDPPSWSDLSARFSDLRRSVRSLRVKDQPEHLRVMFTDKTLGQLLWLRRELDPDDRTDRFILATTAGILHLNARRDGTPRGLSVAMPNTFSMSPRYVVRYVRKHRLQAPLVDVVPAVETRIERLRPFLALPVRGKAWREDVLNSGRVSRRKADLIFASPPYLHVMKYGKFNWLRLWLLGEDPRQVDESLLATSSVHRYLEFMRMALERLAKRLSADGYCCLVVGDVESRGDEGPIRLAEEVAESCVRGSGLQTIRILVDPLLADQKVSRIWGATRGRATKTDRILVLGGPEAEGLPAPPVVDWAAA